MDKKNLLGVGITDASNNEILEYIISTLKKRDKKYYIVTPNPEFLVYANKHDKFKSILNNARLALPDGTGVIWAGKLLGQNFKQRVTGTDLVENLCEKLHGQPITVGFLGAGPKIAERAAECLSNKYPGLKISFVNQELDKSIKPTDILFVAFGFPKQEEWMAKNINHLPVKVMMGVGGAFDYISGKVPRAPVFVQRLGFEWLFRLIVQPWRFRRQLALLKFIQLILIEKFKSDRI